MRKIICLLATFIFFSCHCDLKKNKNGEKNVSFKDYFNEIKNTNLPNELYGYGFMSLRDINYEMTFPDSLIVVFDHNNCNIKITNCLNIKSSSLKTIEEIRSKTINTLEKILQFNINILETNESQFMIYVNKEIFDGNTLPFYKARETSNTTYVVLLYLYKGEIQDSTNNIIYKYYNPVRIEENWFYYLD